jgi:hypothetical protein
MVLSRSVDPDEYAYGGLHHYVVAAAAVLPAGLYALVFDPPPDEALQPDAYAEWRDTQRTHVYVLSRTISAVLASAQVLIVYLVGLLLFDRFVGILAALFLAVAPYFVVIAHFATVDTAANFWCWLAILFAVLFWTRGDSRWYVLAALSDRHQTRSGFGSPAAAAGPFSARRWPSDAQIVLGGAPGAGKLRHR